MTAKELGQGGWYPTAESFTNSAYERVGEDVHLINSIYGVSLKTQISKGVFDALIASKAYDTKAPWSESVVKLSEMATEAADALLERLANDKA